jgi:DNA-binding LacI/PurR family transcriptional regulator
MTTAARTKPARKPRLRDVAARAQLSVTAVSMALSDHPSISDQTKERIRRISRDLGYVRPRAAGRISPASPGQQLKGRRIGFMIVGSPLNDEVYATLLRELTLLMQASGARLEVASVEVPQLDQAVEMVTTFAAPLDGLILVNMVSPELLRRLEQTRQPVVIIGTRLLGGYSDTLPAHIQWVTGNDMQMGRIATLSLLDSGHQRVAFVCEQTPPNMSDHQWLQGYRLAHLDRDRVPAAELVQVTGRTLSGAEPAVAALLKLPKPPDGYVVPDMRIAGTLVTALAIRGRSPSPRDIVVGSDAARASHYGLSDYPIVAYDLKQQAAIAHDMLGRMMHYPLPAGTHVVVEPVLRNLPR